MSEARWDIPKTWAWATAAEIARIVGGGTPSSKVDDNFAEIGIPWITPADLTKYEASHISRGRRDLSEKGLSGSGAQVIPAGSVLFSSRAPIGYCVIASNDVTTNQGFKSLVLRGGIVPEYVRHYLIGSKDYAESKASGTTFMELSGARVAELAIPVAPLEEQTRIVAKIDGLIGRTARARTELARVPALVSRYKQRFLALAFSGELTRGWRAEKGLESPSGTKVLGEVITDIVSGKNLRCVERPPEESEKGVVKVSAVTWGRFNPLASKTLPKNFAPPEQTRIRPSDFLISRANTLELVAAVVIVDDTPPNLFLSDKVLRLELPEEDKPWLLWFLRSAEGRAAIEARATGNQLSMRNLSQSALRSIEIPWPPSDERKEIVRRIEATLGNLDRMAADHDSAAKLLPKLNAAILAKAFRGELVPQDPDDEPVSALLERARHEQSQPRGRTRRTTINSKDSLMAEQRLQPSDRILQDSENWPASGLPVAEVMSRNPLPHDDLRDALFDLLSGSAPRLRQEFDPITETMVIKRVAA